MRAGEKTSSHVDLSQRWREGRGGNEQREIKVAEGQRARTVNSKISGTDKSRGMDGGERRGEKNKEGGDRRGGGVRQTQKMWLRKEKETETRPR